MSAFIVSKAHIDALLTFANKHKACIPGANTAVTEDLSAIGQELVNENTRSVNHRYDESAKPEEYLFNFGRDLSPVECLKALSCYDYQCNETDDYEDSVAAGIVRAIQQKAINLLPGYTAADWEIRR